MYYYFAFFEMLTSKRDREIGGKKLNGEYSKMSIQGDKDSFKYL